MVRALLVLALLTGCASPPGDDALGRARVAVAAKGARDPHAHPRHATLRYELAERPFDLPIVHGTVSGVPTTFLVDTGANVHILGATLAKKIGLPMTRSSSDGFDHVGRTITTWRVDDPRITVDEWGAVDAPSVVATEIPATLEKLGVGAILSPQKLAGAGGDAVLLDLYRGEMRSAWWDDVAPAMTAAGGEARACEQPDRQGTGLAYVVRATVEGQPATLLVDTGAQRSDVFASSTAGKALDARSVRDDEPVFAASGKLPVRRLARAHVGAGSVGAVVDVGLVPGAADRACPRDGVLAMDVLRGCKLLLGRTRAAFTCTAIDGSLPARPRSGGT